MATREERERVREQQERVQLPLAIDLPDPREAPVKTVTGKRQGDTARDAAAMITRQHRFIMLGAFYRSYVRQKGILLEQQDGLTYKEAMLDINMEKESSPEKRIEELRDQFFYLEPVPGLKRRVKRMAQVHRISAKGVLFATTVRENGSSPAAELFTARLDQRPEQIRATILEDYARLTSPYFEHLPLCRPGCGCEVCCVMREVRRLFGLPAVEA